MKVSKRMHAFLKKHVVLDFVANSVHEDILLVENDVKKLP